MSIRKIPLITTLLRASRNQDDDVLHLTMENMETDGINEDDLNATDCSGRVSTANTHIELTFLCADRKSENEKLFFL